MAYRNTPPCSDSNTPYPVNLSSSSPIANIATPCSIASVSEDSVPEDPSFQIPQNLTQATVDASRNSRLKRYQQDLLVLTSFNDNSTLHWRPSWFKQQPFSSRFWTLHNPPNVVTEALTYTRKGGRFYTRRIRGADDPPAIVIKTWDHWNQYCDMYGIPQDFFSEEQVDFMRLGLPRLKNGSLTAPPAHPLYPEPQPLGMGRYILDPATYTTHLPAKFHSVNHAASKPEDVEAVVVCSDGSLVIERREILFLHSSQWTHYDGTGEYQMDEHQRVEECAPKQQGPGRRWAYLPWTKEQEASCHKVLKLKLKLLRKARAHSKRTLREFGL